MDSEKQYVSTHRQQAAKRLSKKNQLRQARHVQRSKNIASVASETSVNDLGNADSIYVAGATQSATECKFKLHDEEIDANNDECGFNLQDSRCENIGLLDNGKPICTSSFRLCDISLLSDLVSSLNCSVCQKSELEIVESDANLGLASELVLQCRNCQSQLGQTMTSRRIGEKLNSPFEVSQRTVTAMVDMGVGFAGLEKFCTVMGMKSLHHKTFNRYVQTVTEAVGEVADDSLETASKIVRKVYNQITPVSSDIINIAVSYDGSWMTRGHTSNFGVGVVIDVVTGLILDYQVLSKYCHSCAISGKNGEEWKVNHAPNCDKNFDGTSGAMEVAAAVMMWKRSIEKHGIRYTTVLSDGDSKTFSELCKAQIYGNNHPIEKEECINHVSKRMGTALRKIISEYRAKGVTLGGRGHGKLTQDTVGRLTLYYQRAIRNNLGDTNAMKNAAYATLFHAVSTDGDPHHTFCPTGSESCCFFNRAVALGKQPERHIDKVGTPLSKEVGEQLLPIYKRLTDEDLLRRCTSGKTQNANESLHSIIWSKCPKTSFMHRARVETGVRLAVSHFNRGRSSLVDTLKCMGMSPSALTLNSVRRKDQQRLKMSRKRLAYKTKHAREMKKLTKLQTEEREQKKEGGPSYSPGEF